MLLAIDTLAVDTLVPDTLPPIRFYWENSLLILYTRQVETQQLRAPGPKTED